MQLKGGKKISLKVNAYHEAGHAVAAHVLGLTIELLDIKEDDKHAGNFRVVLPWGSTIPAIWRYHFLREFVEKYDVVLMAVYPSSLMIEGTTQEQLQATAQSDRNMLTQDSMDAFPHPYEDPWVEEMDKAREAGTRNESTSETLQNLDSCKRRLADAYYAWVRLRAEALVHYPPHRYAIEVLAAKLLETRTLTSQEAHAIIAAALNDLSASA